ncbi:cobaltochelatase subunit CobN [Cereibacter changlensis JA139]|uniref:Cobaltochelatase subunit CobN n=2 Tax=Cereibacter changlensis TaxID=402884 RepID=A0A2T4JRV4_9RHOB|nr:cobaltochelatase subunit CobN [Cereibacter changlensis]PTE20629.1 cobaltochelatase subunit CobN [Cereibacter changlensis JA139]PZX55061.1 cobaltochelatase CobN [Cereibacter changlensis]
MHLVFRESHGLEEAETPFDPGQDPADLVVLSFSDSDLGAFSAGWHRAKGTLPSLRLANLVALRHPLSVDTYAERTLGGAKAVLVRVIGGEDYWAYGLATLQDLARRQGIALAVLPADGREDARLDRLSTLPVSTLRRLTALCDAGGAVAAQAALAQLALAAGLYAGPVIGAKTVPDMGFYDPGRGVIPAPESAGVLVSFYRSYLTAGDTAPVDALIAALRQAGFAAHGVFAPSLKSPGLADWLAPHLRAHPPLAIVNATAFSAQGPDGMTPFEAADCPVFQVALSTARRREWAVSDRGLSPADLAMHVVLPEVDGRLFAGVVSFKSPGKRDPALQFNLFAHRPDAARIEAVVARVSAWDRLRRTPVGSRDLALVLSTYPGKGWQMAHAVGLDALASTEAVLEDLAGAGYGIAPGTPLESLQHSFESWPLDAYRAALASLPPELQADLHDTWGAPEEDPACRENAFHFAALRRGRALVALQPERGEALTRDGDYHDLTRTPRHGYVAFYLWLRAQAPQALIHMGAHGTLEWLPGKAVALSGACWPEALTGATPVIYPFIVNDPGEAAQAKRRIGALTLGHLPPPLAEAGMPETLAGLERLLDEYSTADGLDPARRGRLIGAIRDEARARGVEDDLGIPPGASAAEAIVRIDRFVCDIKESRFGVGLHVFGRGDCGEAERDGLLSALSGCRVRPGPAGSPQRRADVLPTGRNLFSVDPRAVPSRAAHAQGVKLAEELIRRHLQDHGDYPRGLVIDLWGSASMRTAGEEFAMALHLAGLAPRWDEGSARVAGFEVIPLALLGRPRIDLTLRVSGLFRDIFPGLAQLFEAGAEALAEREEPPGDNPYRQRAARVFGPKPGMFGLGMGSALEEFTEGARLAAGEAWLAASSWAIGKDGQSRQDRPGIEARVLAADSFVHPQDLAESDLLLAADYAAHEAGFAAAVARLGGEAPALYHLDTTQTTPRARSLTEEIARTVRARAANPDWATGMMRHGFRGAAEIAATLDHMAAFAHLAQVVPAHLFDLYHEATLGRPDLVAFLAEANPQALEALRSCFRRLHDAGLWTPRRNSIAALLESSDASL